MSGRFAFGGRAVVTARAGSHHLGMIHLSRRFPSDGIVAKLASIGGADMSCIFTARGKAVMAARTNAHYLGVVDLKGGHKRHFVVALFTQRATANVCSRFTLCDYAVVTT